MSPVLFNKILIANRGEIACRIMRTCRRLGIRTVAVYSEADATAQHVRQADEAWPIGGARPQDSYLRGDVLIEVARKSGAQAIHPGYGFVSENADFAEAVTQAGIVFVGPTAASMRKMGSKAGAKDLMASVGVPVVPGYTGEGQAAEYLQVEADRVGYPLMIKAAHGGGGKGMRIVRTAGDFPAALESCQREAKSAFGRDRVLLERYLEHPRHIEFQVFADAHGNTMHLGERECSAQRRYQKVIEESPSPFLSAELRSRMGDAAVKAARAIDYRNAGTVEFIVSATGDFHFMEINTRLQVEHPVTEMVTGLDLIEWQLRVAAGLPLPLAPGQVNYRGHAIEVRLYAEDPEKGFLPGSGKLESLNLPLASERVRLDAGVIAGDTVSIHYDPMIAKLVVHGDDRPGALALMRDALADCRVVGPKSNVEFLEKLVRHPIVVSGNIDTSYLDRHLDEVLPPISTPDPDLLTAAAIACLLFDEDQTRLAALASSDPWSPWALVDGWRLGHAGHRKLCLGHRGERMELLVHGAGGDYRFDRKDQPQQVANAVLQAGVLSVQIENRSLSFRCHVDAGSVFVHDGAQRLELMRLPSFETMGSAGAGGGDRILAPMPGRIVLVRVVAGEVVVAGQEVLVMEAMKMELSLKAPRAGIIGSIQASMGDSVESDAVLVRLQTP